MSDQTNKTDAPFSTRTAALMVCIGVFAFSAVMTLMAFSDDLRPKNQAGSHPYSTAATGYGAWVKLLEGMGETVRVSRVKRSLEDRDAGLMILTLEGYGMGDLDPYTLQEPALIVLPKWHGSPDPLNPHWQAETHPANNEFIERALHIVDETASIERIPAPSRIKTGFGLHNPKIDTPLQLIQSDNLDRVVSVDGLFLVAKLPYQEIYILSDPDLVNTFGLNSQDNAKFAYALSQYVASYEENTIIFDATLHGFIRSESVFKAALSPPYLGATLSAFAAAMLLAWSAFMRFGEPLREQRAILLGKQALVDNSAGLFAMTERERKLSPGYLALIRRAVAKDIGAPRTMGDADLRDLFNRISSTSGNQTPWNDLADPMRDSATSREDLVKKALALWTWRKEITHGRD